MADPVSAASSAIGAVSLGIQVCQGLVSYYADYKSFDDDIDRIIGKLRGLEETLENLKNGITRFQNANAKEVEDVNKKISACDNGILRLQTILNKCRASSSTNSVHRFVQKTLYPFRKNTLKELDASVRDLQGNLDTGLLSFLMGASNEHGEGLSILISTSQTRGEEFNEARHEIHSTATEVRGIRDGVTSIQQQADIIQASNANINSKLDDQMEILKELFGKFLEDHSRANKGLVPNSELAGSQNTTAMQNSARLFQARLIEKPSLLLAACEDIDCAKDLSQSPSMTEYRAYNPSSSRRSFRRRVCFCPPSAYSLEYRHSHQSQPHGPVWGARFNSSAVVHHKGCALFKYGERDKSRNLRVVYCGRFIARAIRMSIDLTWGAGGYSISPNLSCDRVVSCQSSIFQLLKEYKYFQFITTAATLTEKIESLMRSIGGLYRDGKASVHDVDEGGDNILHKLAKMDIFMDQNKVYFAGSLALFKYLSDCGVRMDRVNAQGRTCLDELQSRWNVWSFRGANMMIDSMVDMGAEFVGINDYWTPLFAESARKFEELAEVSDSNEICRAVLRRSEPELRKVLQCSHHLIDEPNALGLRPLHLSASWPCGIEILLGCGADIYVKDECGYYPVDHAISLACPESLALFAKTEDSWNRGGTLSLAFSFAATLGGDQAIRVGIAKAVIKMAANQRRKLQALISEYLPESPICTHLSCGDQLLDVHAFDAVAALKQHGVFIPIPLQVDKYRGTVYHLPIPTTKILNSLWEAGFRDINEPDPDGRTPLILPEDLINLHTNCLKDFLERVDWFLVKGVDPEQKIQHIHQNSYWRCNSNVGCSCLKSGHTVMHFLAFNLSIITRWDYTGYHRNLNIYKRGDYAGCYRPLILEDTRLCAILKDILNNENRDACKCACASSAGCQAINITIKYHQEFFLSKFDSPSHFDTLIWPIPAAKANDFISETTFSEIIRTLTFHALGLTHTCCRGKKGWLNGLLLRLFEDEDDISEIHDEEREDLQLLEDLLLEFEQQRRDKPCSFQKFISGYFVSRMREVLSEKALPEVLLEEEKIQEMSEEEESLDEVSKDESLDESSEAESLHEVSEEETLDGDDFRAARRNPDDTSSRQNHRVTEVPDESKNSD